MSNSEQRTARPGRFAALYPFSILMGWPALVAVIILVATVITVVTDSGYASYLSSRLAPAVALSNGAEVTLLITVDDTAADLRQAGYSLHVPRGVSVRGLLYDARGSIEAVSVTSDLPAGHYRLSVTVRTDAPSIAMTASLQIHGAACPASPATSSGRTGRTLSLTLRC